MDNKNIFAANLKRYMELNGKTRRDVSEAIGVSYYTFTDWVKGNAYPRIDKIELMANYFGISKSDLVEERTKETVEHYYLNDDARELAEFMFKNPEYKVLFDASRKVKREDIEFVKKMIDRMSGGDTNDSGC